MTQPLSPSSQPFLPHEYQHQRRIILQILTDRVTRHEKPSDASPKPNTRNPGHSLDLTTKGTTDDIYTPSARTVEDELEAIRILSPLVYNTITSFFHINTKDSDYEDLSHKASKPASFPSAPKTYAALEIALHLLVIRLLGVPLYTKFPANNDPKKTHRTQTMEENYREIYRVFLSWCEDLSRRHEKFRNKAKKNTVITTNQSASTVERAISFSEKTSSRYPDLVSDNTEHRRGAA